MNIPVVHGDLSIVGIAPENVKIITGKLSFLYTSDSLGVIRVQSVAFGADSFENDAFIANLSNGTATIDGVANLLEIGNFTSSFASIGGVRNTLEIRNGAQASIEVGGTANVVEVRAGNVTYTVSGTGNSVDDGAGNSHFFAVDAFDFDISDGAGDDTIIVDGGDGDITLGEGADVVWVISGEVDIFDFVLGEDTLFLGAEKFDAQGELETFYPFDVEIDFAGGGVSVSFAEDGLA